MNWETGLGIGVLLSIGLAGIGSAIGLTLAGKAGEKVVTKNDERFASSLIYAVLAETPSIYGLLVALVLLMNYQSISDLVKSNAISNSQALWTPIAAGLCVGVTGFFAALGIGYAAAAGIIVNMKEPKLFGKSLVFIILPETIVIYGLLIALLLLRTLGAFGPAVFIENGSSLMLPSLIISSVGITGVLLGKLGAEGIRGLAEREESFGKNMVFVVLVESIAIYGLLVSILMLRGFGII